MLFERWLLNTVHPIPRLSTGTVFIIKPIDLHPLSLEELLRVPGRHRSGADYYKEHLFIRVLSHTLDEDGDEESNLLEQVVRSSSPEPFSPEDEVEAPPKYSAGGAPRSSTFTSKLSNKLKLHHRSGTAGLGRDDLESVDVANVLTYADYDSRYGSYVHLLPSSLVLLVVTSFSIFQKQGYKIDKTVRKLMRELEEGGRVNVVIKPVCLFLFKDGRYDQDRTPAIDASRHFIDRDRHLDTS
jgi:hypothetical protein